MKTKVFTLFGAALVLVSGVALAGAPETRSSGAHPVVYDDYPESELSIAVSDDIVLTMTGEARVRFEWVENTTDFTDATDDSAWFSPARFNVGFRVDLPRDVAAVVELQGAYELGADGGPALGRTGSAGDITLHQGYFEMANIGDSVFSLRAGRQELAYGTEFLLGNEDWYDGRTWDGAKAIFELTDEARLDLFWAKVAENDTNAAGKVATAGDNDIDLFGAYFSHGALGGSKIGLDAYLLHMNDNTGVGIGNFDSSWVGVRLFRDVEQGLHFSAELTYQFGEFDVTGTDIDAQAFEGFLGYTWGNSTHSDLHAGVTWTSGHDGTSSDAEQFFTPGGEIHSRLGLMDIIAIPQGTGTGGGLLAYTIGYAGQSGNHSWGVDLWAFELEETAAGIDDSLGQEYDLWYNYQYSKNMVAQFALGLFDAGDNIEDANTLAFLPTDDALRLYANLLVRF